RASTSVRDYAKMLGVTPSHLSEALRLETGLTAGDLIRARLLLEAKRLLLHSELTIAEIGYELGFEDPSISHVLCDERSRQAPWSSETGFAKSTGNSCHSPRLGIWLITSTEEAYPVDGGSTIS